MKRECLLSTSYVGAPMTLRGTELVYSALVNEVVRELGSPLFCGDGDGTRTHYQGMCEGILVMYLMARGEIAGLNELRSMTSEQRNKAVLDFALENEDEIAGLKPAILARLEALAAAAVESEEVGKPRARRRESSPPSTFSQSGTDSTRTSFSGNGTCPEFSSSCTPRESAPAECING